MSKAYFEPKPRRKSSCCIVLLICGLIVGGIIVAGGIFSYRLLKDNFRVVDVAEKRDPGITVTSEEMLPEVVGEFQRITASDNLTSSIPNMKDLKTSGVVYGVYQDAAKNEVSVIAVATKHGQVPDMGGMERLVQRRDGQKSNHGVSFRDTISGPEPNTIVTWTKPNWTFIVQTTSTLSEQFVKEFNPAGN